MVDAHTKRLEVRQVVHASSAAVISVLRSLLASFDVTWWVLSVIGTAFVSDVIRRFYEQNGVQAVTSAPYHPATNGQADRYVAELKKDLIQNTARPVQRSSAGTFSGSTPPSTPERASLLPR